MPTRRVQLVLVLALLSATLLASTACSIGVDIGPSLQDIAQKAIDQVDNLNATLGEASAGWQDTIKSSIDQLTDKAQHIVRDDLSNTLNRAIQAGGIEVRCGGDFLRDRAHEEINNLAIAIRSNPAQFFGGPVTLKSSKQGAAIPIQPHVCQPAPDHIGFTLGKPDSLNSATVTIDGYNFDSSAPLKAFLIVGGGAPQDVTNGLSVSSYYQLVLNFGANGIPWNNHDPVDRQVVQVRWQDHILSEIPIVTQLPACQTQNVLVPDQDQSTFPQHLDGQGDTYINPTNNVFVAFIADQQWDSQHVWATGSMYDQESGGDTSSFQTNAGHGPFTMPLWSAPPGTAIQYVENGQHLDFSFLHHYQTPEPETIGGAGWIASEDFAGFGGFGGPHATVHFRNVHVHTVQTTLCVQQNLRLYTTLLRDQDLSTKQTATALGVSTLAVTNALRPKTGSGVARKPRPTTHKAPIPPSRATKSGARGNRRATSAASLRTKTQIIRGRRRSVVYAGSRRGRTLLSYTAYRPHTRFVAHPSPWLRTRLDHHAPTHPGFPRWCRG